MTNWTFLRSIPLQLPWALGQTKKVETLGLQCWHGAARPMCASHQHNEIEWNLLESGALEYLFGGQLVRLKAGELAVFWGAIPHQLTISEVPARMRWLTLPLATFLGWDLPREWTHAILRGRVVLSRDALDAARFEQWETDLSQSSNRAALLEMEARLHRLAQSPYSPRSALTSAKELGHVEVMTAFIAEHYADELSIETIARVANLHPNYAMNLFKTEFGLSLGEFLTRTRISHAQRLLATTSRGVLAIAFECGFGSASRFHAAFKRICGKTPNAYRTDTQGRQ